MPSTPYDAKGLLKSAIRDNDPVIFIEDKHLYTTKGEVPSEDYIIPIGKADIKCTGTDVTLISYSRHVLLCLEAAQKLADEGISAEVLDLRTLSPLDKDTILSSVRKTGHVVVVHQACKQGGVGGDIASMIMEEAFDCLDAPVIRVAGPNVSIPYNMALEQICTPGVKEIYDAVRKICV
jgi:pyruvate dehydrogenase E1 component beta subunit